MKQFIIKIPEGEILENLGDEAKRAIKMVNGQFPSGRAVDTHAVDGYEIKLVMCNSDADTLNAIFEYGYPSTNENGDQVLVDLELDWEVLAEEGKPTDKDLILPFLDDDIIYDEDGEILSSEPKIDLTSLQTYAGKKWI